MMCRLKLCILPSAFALLFSIFHSAMLAQAPDKPETKLDENPAKSDPEQEHAIELYKQGKFVSAMPLFEKLVADRPTDAGVRESFASVSCSMLVRFLSRS